MNITKKKVAFHTLGCKLNFAETSTLSRSFPEDRFERVPAGRQADIYVINTCSVTDAADKKCRQAIKKFIQRSPEAFICVVGCYAQLNPQEISAIPGVDLVLGTNEKFDLPGYIGNHPVKVKPEIHSGDLSKDDPFNLSYSAGDRTRSFLKVQDGCDYGCTYCTIPKARGNSKNPAIYDLVGQALNISARGVKEVVLTGVNIGDFGRSTGNTFSELLNELVKVPGIERYRLSSVEPNLLTDELIAFASVNPKVLPHFHIPLQSGSNKILGLMRRRYNRDVFSDRVSVIKRLIPAAGIGADVITGFPGENDRDFEDTYHFLEDLPLSYLHVFTFSERPGTIAANLPDKVNNSEKENRSRRLIDLSRRKRREFVQVNMGSVAEVLFENTRYNGMMTGYTGNYIKVEYPWQPYLAGKIKHVRLEGVSENGNVKINLI